MRKHFLLLFLMALLPLAGWAADPVAYTDVTVTVTWDATKKYTGAAETAWPAVTVNGKKDGAAAAVLAEGTDYVLVWKNPSGAEITNYADIKNAGTYTVEVKEKTAGDTFTPATGKSLTQSFTMGKHAIPVVVSANATSITYGDAAPALNLLYTITSAPEQFDDDPGHDGGVAVLGHPVDEVAFDDLNAGNKSFTLVARSYVNYNVVVANPTGSLTVAKKAITITTAPITGTWTYGGGKPTPTLVNYSAQLVPGDALTGTLAFDYKKYVDPNETLIEGDILPAGTIRVYGKGLSNDNYAITWAYAEFTVGQKALTSDMIAAMEAKTYNGANQKPTLTVTDGTLPIVAADYTAAWQYSLDNGEHWTNIADPAAATAFKGAALYKVTLSGATGNYKSPTLPAVASKTYTINKKTLYIKTNNKEKTFDGLTPYAPDADAAHLTFVGLETGDAADYNGLVVSLGDGALAGSTKGVDADVYPINVVDDPTEADNFAHTNALRYNYTPQFGSLGKLTINKRKITIKANNITKNYGESDDYDETTGVVASAVVAAGVTTAGTVQLASGTLAADGVAGWSDIWSTRPTLKRVAGEAAGPYDLTPSGGVIKNNMGTAADPDDDVDVTKNYEITYTKGTFTIEAGGFTIWADDKSSVFGSETLETLTATVDGIPAADAAKIVFNEGAITTNATAASNRGVYTITIDKSKINFSAIEALYDITKVVVVPGNYTITPKALKIKAKDQAHTVGQTVTEASLENIEFVTEDVDPTDKAGVVGHITLAFSSTATTTTAVVPVDGDKKLTADAVANGWTGTAAATAAKDKGIWVNGIEIKVTAGDYWNTANYTLTGEGAETKAGTLYVTAAATGVIFDNTATATTQITNVAGKIVDAKISTTANKRTLYANQWNALVLPFDIAPFDFCTAIGKYAVFDVLQAGGDALNFKITINEIPAYTPFLVKVDQEIDLSTKTFPGVIIKAIDNDALTQSTSAEANWSIVGTVKKADIDAPTWTIQPNDANGNIKLLYREGAWNYKAFTAYSTTQDGTVPAAAPMIFVEEPDGSTTAITTINADGVAVAKDGWYTLNGVKLQGMPTEKGVYINNGKKVVLK